jgi:hypothetical protein
MKLNTQRWLMTGLVLSIPLAAFAQTQIALRKNKYSERDDVQLGRQAAAEIERKIRILRDAETGAYLERVGGRLAAAIPPQFQHREFEYYFKVVEAREINAFALPGGPMYVNTGMILAAKREGEMAGVMSHELAHVALRHGTAQATKAAPYQTLGALGQIGGAILGGALGGILGQGSQMGVGVYLLRFSREYETEADILGAQIMARAGYNPRDLAEMFRTIQEQGSGGGPEFLSSHPNPENRFQRIEQEASLLRIQERQPNSRDFTRIQAHLRGMPVSAGRPEMAERERERDRGSASAGGRLGRVEPPSATYRSFSDNNLFRIEVPDNWREIAGQNAVWFAPEGGYGELQGQTLFTHAATVGVAQTRTREMGQATQEFVRGLMQGNTSMRPRATQQRTTLAGRPAIYSSFTNISEATRETEIVDIYTLQLRSGELFYLMTVAPQDEYRDYQRALQRIARSLQLQN